MTEFKLPELGENIEQGDLVRLMIAPGADVKEGQPVMELETDKAVIEVPSSVSGVVSEIRVKEGDKLKVGQVIFTVENGTGAKAQRRKARLPQKVLHRQCDSQKSLPMERRASPPARTGETLRLARQAGRSPRDTGAGCRTTRLQPQSPHPNSSSPNSARTSTRAIWSAS